MENDKRNKQIPVPNDLDNYLTDAQKTALKQVGSFGWDLAFVRRQLFQETTAILKDASGDIVGILEKDGEINKNLDIPLRKD